MMADFLHYATIFAGMAAVAAALALLFYLVHIHARARMMEVLDAVYALRGAGYAVSIGSEIEARTGKHPSMGMIYGYLDHLERHGLVVCSFVAGGPERGGRVKRIYEVTPVGIGVCGIWKLERQ